jgi:hypothetical protein
MHLATDLLTRATLPLDESGMIPFAASLLDLINSRPIRAPCSRPSTEHDIVVTLTKSDRIWGSDFFPDLGPEMTGAASPRRKGALILTGIVLAAAGTFSLGAVIFIQLSTLRIEVASLKRELAGSTAKLARLEANAARSHPNEIKDGADARMLTSSIPRRHWSSPTMKSSSFLPSSRFRRRRLGQRQK